MARCRALLSQPFFHDRRVILVLWLILAVLATILKWHHSCNNFLIFRGVYHHAVAGLSLYDAYPLEYFDVNHYGPLFSLVIAPFAVLPLVPGLLLWLIALTLSLYYAIARSGFSDDGKIFIYWFCSDALLNALFMQQFNIAIAALLIAAFFLLERKKEFSAAFLIVLGTLVKIYGIVGLAFFFFTPRKGRFILAMAVWSVLLFVAPMLITDPAYVVGQYGEWLSCLVEKNGENLTAYYQNISALGMVRRITGILTYSDLWLIVPALVLFCLPYLRLSQYRHVRFRHTYLASVLLFVVLFSTGSESSSYIIALCGVVIWYISAPYRHSRWDVALMVFVFLLSGMGGSDIWPRALRKGLIQPYALRALPCLIVWLRLSYDLLVRHYAAGDEGKATSALAPATMQINKAEHKEVQRNGNDHHQ